jgi:hypothetical protein
MKDLGKRRRDDLDFRRAAENFEGRRFWTLWKSFGDGS